MRHFNTQYRLLALADQQVAARQTGGRNRHVLAASIAASIAALTWTPPAHAVNGCLVLLCFAASNWQAIPDCVPPIEEVLFDIARGRPFPNCPTAGGGNKARHRWARPPEFCPPQYTHVSEHETGPTYTCDYHGAVDVRVNGAPWARVWWRFGGDSSTEFSPQAKAQLGTWDTKFDDDYAAWLASLPPPPSEDPHH